MTDIVFLTLPKVDLRAPLIGPSVLKSVCKLHGYTAKTIDLNVKLFTETDFADYTKWWLRSDLVFTDNQRMKQAWNDCLEKISYGWVEELKDLNPKFIGVTLLGSWSLPFARIFLPFVKQHMPDVKIVVGGPGAEHYSKIKNKFDHIYAYVEAEGEKTIIDIIEGRLDAPGVNGNPPEQIQDLNNIPFADYSDVDFSKYSSKWYTPNATSDGCDWLPITGSRGCIKKCTFCNVPLLWKKYIYKSGERLADELEYHHKTTGINNFIFTDSLLNGNIEQLEQMVDGIIAKDIDIKWEGQWIARGEKVMSQSLWKKLSKAGLKKINVGIESGSAKVRNDMKKGVREEDILYTFQQCSKNNIEMVPLIIIGYPTEGEKEFQEQLDFLHRYKDYSHTVPFVSIGKTMGINPDTPVYNHFEGEWHSGHNWKYEDNDFKTRIERWFKYRDVAIELGWRLPPGMDVNPYLVEQYKKITGIDLNKKYKENTY